MADTAPEAPERTTGDVETFLNEKFPGVVEADTRDGYEGFVVDGDKLKDVALALRDELGFDYLNSATAVDYLDDGYFEMVYHATQITQGGKPLSFKARTPRETASLPSLVDVWPGADFQEREAYDLMGIRFEGHPNLTRILMWEGFEGHPLRRDWREAYHEEDAKPFKSRWPGGQVWRSEENNVFGKNVAYPPGFDVDNWSPGTDEALYESMTSTQAVEHHHIKTDQIVVNLGPQHPSTHGVFRMVVTLDGETITRLEPVMGYLHRNHEKIGERNTYLQNMPYTDRLDYICSLSNNLAYAITVEKLMGQDVPERAELVRVLLVELTRIMNHMFAMGMMFNDLGAFQTPVVYALIERELILDLFEAVTGSRMMCNYMRFGGIPRDLPPHIGGPAILEGDKVRDMDTMQYITELVEERLPRAVEQMQVYLTGNEIFKARGQGVGILPPEQAIAFSAAGPVLRASGVPYDIRRANPYSIYDELDFDIAVRYGCDVYDRYMVRIDEMYESLRICRQLIPRLKDTAGQEFIAGKNAYQARVPAGESYGQAENPKGELGFYVVSNGKPNPWRYHVRSPCFINLTALGKMCEGVKVADTVVILGSIDIVLGEVDR